MSTTTTYHHGQSTQDKTREQERQSSEEIWRQICDGQGNTEQRKKSRTGATERQCIINLENTTTKIKPFILHVKNTEEIVQHLRSIEGLNHNSIGFLFSNTRYGTFNRKYFFHDIPQGVEDIYVSLYLQKHTGFTSM